MGRNLGPLNIKDSYEGLVQISGSQLTDGSGSLISNLEVTASYATTASYAENSSADDLTLQQVTDNGATTNQAITLNQASGSIPLQVNSLAGGSPTLFRLSRLNANANNFVVTAGDATNATLSMGNNTGFGNISFPASGDNQIEATTKLRINTPNLYITGSVSSFNDITAPTFSGSLYGNALTSTSASHADNSDSSLTAISASHAIISDTSISSSYSTFSETSVSSSHALSSDTAISASYALTASYAENAGASFPYTGSAGITGSLNVVGPIISGDGTNTVGTNGNEASIAGRNNVTTGNTAATVGGEYHDNSAFRGFIGGGEQTTLTGTNVAAMGGYNNNVGGTYGAFAGGQGNNIGGTAYFAGGLLDSNGSGYIYAMLGGVRLDCQTDSTFLGGGEDNTSVSGHRKGAIIGGDNNTLNGNNTDRSVIIGGTTNTIQSGSQNSVILGGQNIVSAASDTVYVPNLNISGSLTDSDGNIGTAGQVLSSNGVDKVQWAAGGGGGAAFPYTGSADISGSLNVSGSITGVLQAFENIDIKYQAVANSETPNILIGYADGAFDANGVNNILLGSSNNAALTTTNRYIGVTGINYSNAIIGGNQNYISGSAGSRIANTILGGIGNAIGKDDLAVSIQNNGNLLVVTLAIYLLVHTTS
jgi:hypothetical protein